MCRSLWCRALVRGRGVNVGLGFGGGGGVLVTPENLMKRYRGPAAGCAHDQVLGPRMADADMQRALDALEEERLARVEMTKAAFVKRRSLIEQDMRGAEFYVCAPSSFALCCSTGSSKTLRAAKQ